MLICIPTDFTWYRLFRPCEGFVFNRATHTVRLIVGREPVAITLNRHWAVAYAVVAHKRSVRAVYWDLFEIRSKSVSLSVWMIHKSGLEYFIETWFYSWDKICWCKCNLFSFCEIVSWVSVKSYFSNLDQRVVRFRPYFSYIKYIKSVFLCVNFRHCLDKPDPTWIVAFCYLVE